MAVLEFVNEGRLNHSIELTRSFRRNVDSEWETSSYLTVQDPLPAEKLLAEAYTAIQARIQQALAERNGGADESGEQPF